MGSSRACPVSELAGPESTQPQSKSRTESLSLHHPLLTIKYGNFFQLTLPNHNNELPRATTTAYFSSKNITCSAEPASIDESHCKRRPLLLGVGALTTSLLQASSLFAEEIPEKYRAFVDKVDGYSYYYPYDWRDFEFRAHDSAFKDRYMQLHNVRVRFLPTNKTDIHELGPMEEFKWPLTSFHFEQVVSDLVRYKLASPNQYATIFGMQEVVFLSSLNRRTLALYNSNIFITPALAIYGVQRNIDGKNYYTVEYGLQTPNFATNSFATVAIGNGRFYTLIVVANERRWKRYRNQLKVVADSFRMLDIEHAMSWSKPISDE
ncbi:PsbP-like protein 2 [Prunus dulcis]|uniref:PsbP-like protein 2 n=1 Tax=Prunus dulcis TaxID=3755 RepID=A0A4Y1R1G3_PRUDU|nr:PsbP-like protein 2 [Prunus dulcis]